MDFTSDMDALIAKEMSKQIAATHSAAGIKLWNMLPYSKKVELARTWFMTPGSGAERVFGPSAGLPLNPEGRPAA